MLLDAFPHNDTRRRQIALSPPFRGPHCTHTCNGTLGIGGFSGGGGISVGPQCTRRTRKCPPLWRGALRLVQLITSGFYGITLNASVPVPYVGTVNVGTVVITTNAVSNWASVFGTPPIWNSSVDTQVHDV